MDLNRRWSCREAESVETGNRDLDVALCHRCDGQRPVCAGSSQLALRCRAGVVCDRDVIGCQQRDALQRTQI